MTVTANRRCSLTNIKVLIISGCRLAQRSETASHQQLAMRNVKQRPKACIFEVPKFKRFDFTEPLTKYDDPLSKGLFEFFLILVAFLQLYNISWHHVNGAIDWISFLGFLLKLLNVNVKCYYKYIVDLGIQNMNGI